MKKLVFILFGIVLFSCDSPETEKKAEASFDCLDRLFDQESKKVNYYITKSIEAISNSDQEKAFLYRDSALMAIYAEHIIFIEMQKK